MEAALEALGVDRATIDQLEGNSIKVSSTNHHRAFTLKLTGGS